MTPNGCPRWNHPDSTNPHNDDPLVPLVFDEEWVQAIQALRAQAANEANEQFRRMQLDQVIGMEILSDVDARIHRANQGEGDAHVVFGGDWVEPLQILLSKVHVAMLGQFYRRDGQDAQLDGDNQGPLFALAIMLNFMDEITQAWDAFVDAHRAILAMYPNLQPVVERAQGYVREEHAVLRAVIRRKTI
ncbi:hypothetical protein LTR08_002419 [Meristemomyces frigidus]|nr:hypothetical protein LTR08_002419 [Meristemomyces frigidus]